jgi:hypothetical protein
LDETSTHHGAFLCVASSHGADLGQALLTAWQSTGLHDAQKDRQEEGVKCLSCGCIYAGKIRLSAAQVLRLHPILAPQFSGQLLLFKPSTAAPVRQCESTGSRDGGSATASPRSSLQQGEIHLACPRQQAYSALHEGPPPPGLSHLLPRPWTCVAQHWTHVLQSVAC